MPLLVDHARLQNALKSTLQSAIPNATFEQIAFDENRVSLFLLHFRSAIAAFAIGGEDDYKPSYEAFKKKFVERGAQWSSKDVSFVFCVPEDGASSETFQSSVEVDVYFCRKYVLSLGQNIPASLSRLPFFPLNRVESGSIRPPSAQTLLQLHDVPADLARVLVEPGRGSANGILEACIAGRYGKPEPIKTSSDAAGTSTQYVSRSLSTLKSISIENFRAYRKRQDFELGSSITVLYGPNGFGKTSFFDALDFVVTGGVGRLGVKSEGLEKAAKHLDSADEPSTVTLNFEREGTNHSVIRNLSDTTKASFDNRIVDRKEVLSRITGGSAASTERVENLVSLFRATHLFSQERQELTQDITQHCELPGDLVSRMLAFEDYVSGIKKVSDILRFARQIEKSAHEDGNVAKEAAVRDQAELDRLGALVPSNGDLGALTRRLSALLSASGELGIEVDSVDADLAGLRTVRVSLEASAADAATRQSVLTQCLADFRRLRTTSEEVAVRAERLVQRRAESIDANAAAEIAEDTVARLQAELAKLIATESDERAKLEAVNWILSVQPELRRLEAEGTSFQVRLHTELKLREQLQEAVRRSLATEQECAAKVQLVADSLEGLNQRLAQIGSLQSRRAEALLAEVSVAQAQLAEQASRAGLAKLIDDHSTLLEAVSEQGLVVTRRRGEAADVQAEQGEIKNLVADLRSHVADGICLLCGHDHNDVESLLSAIDGRLQQGQRLVEVTAALAEATSRLNELERTNADYRGRIQEERVRVAQHVASSQAYEPVISEYHQALASAGFAPGPALQQELTTELQLTQTSHANVLREHQNVKLAFDAAARARTEAESSSRASNESVEYLQTASKTCQERLQALIRDQRRGAFEVMHAEDGLRRRGEEAHSSVTSASIEKAQASTALDVAKAQSAQTRAEATSAKSTLRDAERKSAGIDATYKELLASLVSAGFASPASEEDIGTQISQTAVRADALFALRSNASELEVAIDVSTSAAALESIRTRLQAKAADILTHQKRLVELGPWVRYFARLERLLETEQAAATEHFTVQYGPRTAVIQRRLRPVYGFEDIEITSKGSRIGVRVKRNGETLKPTDYFSQSQVQTLVLGLFLTACSSQTWSGFSSIMMDDPVAHFDDLNSYALLDLISGLHTSEDGPKQFVISTCDEKLLQLARQKFRHLEGAAKFYRFSAIGASGPVVAAIPA